MFFVCGAPKAGTTSLYNYLRQHPEICMSDPKETWFFCYDFRRGNGWKNYEKGVKWYFEEYFDCCEGEALGEATPRYMADPKSAELISRHFPSAKLIFVLRDPVERLYSQYLQRLSQGKETPTDSFRSFVEKTKESSDHRPDYVKTGKYFQHLKRFENEFGGNQMLVLMFNDLVSSPEEFMKEIFRFLEVDAAFTPDTSTRHNTTRYPRDMLVYRIAYELWEPIERRINPSVIEVLESARIAVRDWLLQDGRGKKKPEMDSSDLHYLKEIYRKPNQRLAEYLGEGLSHWT